MQLKTSKHTSDASRAVRIVSLTPIGSQWQMRDIMNEGLRTLYLACKRNSCFPGQLPEVAGDDDDNNVSIHAIIQGLGLIPIPNELNFPGGHQMALEDEGHGLGLNENSDRDLSPSKRPELMDEPNGESLPRRHEAKEEHLIDGGGQSVRTQGNPSQCGSLTSSSFVKRPLSALAGDSIVSFSDPLFPHFLLTSPVDKIHDDVRDDDGSYDEDVPIVDQHLGFTQQPNLAESTYSPKSPQTAGTQDSAAPTETELGSSYLAEREHFYQNLFSLPRGSLVDMQQNFWPLPSEDPAPSWDGVLAQLFIV